MGRRLDRLHHVLYVAGREALEASPTAAIINSQTAKPEQKGRWTGDLSGYHAGKKVAAASATA